jgi:uncharacterized protein
VKSREFPDGTLFLQAEPGEEVVSAATRFLDQRKIYAGSFTAIGACEEAEVGFWDPKARTYLKETIKGPLEILAMTGNVAQTDDGRSFIHAHIVLGDRAMNTRGGHLFRVIAEPTCEIVLKPLQGIVDRRLVEACGLRLWQL